ncbi:MAG: 50S ribosomal protein L15 [Holosporaceae bacterium]|jgi:large subunit ribosomal protein L15|nr:50S ribosomal protein L15 [Holosporaceae bacterium]
MASFRLNNLKSRHGIDKKALGRGIGSGCGKTCSYGHKGGKARSGRGTVRWFEGGQLPIYRRLPKRGFVSMCSKALVACVNLLDLQRLCEAKVLSSGQDVDLTTLKATGLARKSAVSFRLLAKGTLLVPLQISGGYASAAAVRGVEAAGGTIKVI